MQFTQIEWGSSFYELAVALRLEILRKPLDRTFSPEDLASEKDTLHFAIFDEKPSALATVCARPLSTKQWKIRQMAVAISHQNRGLGSQLLSKVIRLLKAKGAQEITLHARETAILFYEKHGFTATGPIFLEVGLTHRKMAKII